MVRLGWPAPRHNDRRPAIPHRRPQRRPHRAQLPPSSRRLGTTRARSPPRRQPTSNFGHQHRRWCLPALEQTQSPTDTPTAESPTAAPRPGTPRAAAPHLHRPHRPPRHRPPHPRGRKPGSGCANGRRPNCRRACAFRPARRSPDSRGAGGSRRGTCGRPRARGQFAGNTYPGGGAQSKCSGRWTGVS